MKIKFTPSPNQLRIKHLIRNSKKQKFLCDIFISLNRTLSDRIDYPKQFRIRNPIRHSLPITPSDRIFYPKPFRIKNPIRRGFLKKNLSDRISYPKPFRIENPIRIARRMKSSTPLKQAMTKTTQINPDTSCFSNQCDAAGAAR